MVAVVTLLFLISSMAHAQRPQLKKQFRRPAKQQQRPRVNQNLSMRNRTPVESIVVIEPSAPVQNLFEKAEEGIARADWKFVIDSLQRIIDNADGSAMPREDSVGDLNENSGSIFESARRLALKKIAAMPPEGLRAYRLIYDGMAKRLLEMGRSQHDPKPLHQVVHRFLLTRYGDQAAELLASWALDEGHPGAAIALLSDVLELIPNTKIPRDRLGAKLVAAYALLGQPDTAKTFLHDSRWWSSNTDNLLSDYGESLANLSPTERMPRAESLHRWPMVGGTADRQGRMAAADPTLTGLTPWRLFLSGAQKDAWRRVFRDGDDAPLVLPIGQLVSEGDVLFARVQGGCVALDANNLSTLWETQVGKNATRAARPLRPINRFARPMVRRDWTPPYRDNGMWFEDYTAGDIALGHDLVLMITREGRSDYVQRRRDQRSGGLMAWALAPLLGSKIIGGTRLVALDQHTGAIRWQRGRTAEPSDPLGSVLFRSAPLAVEDRLWVLFSRQKDLFAGVLDPQDGTLVAQVPLGSVSHVTRSMPPPIRLAAQDGLVFIPTGQGVLFALDAADHSLRWANRYKKKGQVSSARNQESAEGFLPTPPMVVGGYVLLAPEGENKLLAFDVVTGQRVWSRDRGGSSYLIAGDHQRVWLGGRTVMCLSLSDGEPIWAEFLPASPTGRAVMAGENILVPTLEGLVTYEAVTGHASDPQPTPPAQPPLGNLLSLHHAVYSLQSGEISKFPDVERSYPLALEAYERDRQVAGPALNLAWLELLRGKPAQAYTVLESIPDESVFQPNGLTEMIAHAKVEALLGMSGDTVDSGLSSSKVLELLLTAKEASHSLQDRMRCTLAVAEKMTAMGRPEEAYHQLWNLGISQDAEELVLMEHQVTLQARLYLARKLQHLRADLSTPTRNRVDVKIATSVALMLASLGDTNTALQGRHQLRSALDMGLNQDLAQPILYELGVSHANHQRYAHAEQLFRECASMDTTTAYAMLAQMMDLRVKADALDDDPTTASSLNRALTELVSRYDSLSLDDLPRQAAYPFDQHAGLTTVNEWSSWMRHTYDIPQPLSVSSRFEQSLELENVIAWSIKSERSIDLPRLVEIRDRSPHPMDDRFVIVSPSEVLTCYRGLDQEVLWEADLRQPGTFKDGILARWPEGERVPRAAVKEGQITVFSMRTGLYALEWGTGRRLWTRKYDLGDPMPGSNQLESRLAILDGQLATVLRPGRISLLRLTDGSTIWERDMLGERIGSIELWKDRVLTFDPSFKRAHLFDRADGSLIARALFSQPDPQYDLIKPIRIGDYVYGPTKENTTEGIAAIDLISGHQVWNIQVEKPIVNLFLPGEGYLGVGQLGGDILLVDTSSGETILHRRVEGAQGVVNGALVDGTLLVQYYIARGGIQVTELVGMDIATDAELWRRDDVTPVWQEGSELRVYGQRIPVLVNLPRSKRNRTNLVNLALLDIRTGQSAGEEVSLPSTGRITQYNGDFVLLKSGELAIIGTDAGIQAFPITVKKKSGNRDF